MKFFIYLCCKVLLLTEISARLRLTTPMPSLLRSNDDVATQTSMIADMIDFVNSVYNDDGSNIVRSGRFRRFPSKHSILRRFELPAAKHINLPPSVVVPNDKDTKNQVEKIEDKVRYHVIDNPEVLEEYSNKQKQKNIERLLNPVSVVPDTSAEAKLLSTVENKYYHSKSKSPPDGVQELPTVEPSYRPSFPDAYDDDKLVTTEDIEVTVTEKEITTLRVDAKDHSGNTEKHLEVNNIVETERRTLDNNTSGKKDQAKIEEENAQKDNTKETGQMKDELLLMKDENNYGVIVNKEKSESNKEEYISTKFDHISNESLSYENVHPRDEDSKNDENKHINGTADSNSEKGYEPKKRTWDKKPKKIINVPVERLMGREDQKALKNQKKNKYHDHKEKYSIYSLNERNEDSNKQFKDRFEKRDGYDRKKKDRNDYRWSKKEKDLKKIDKQRNKKDNGYDRMEYEWNKRHQLYDENENLNVKDNQWDENGDFNSRDRNSKQRDNDWDKRDNDWKKRDNDWKKRDTDWDKRDNDWKERNINSKKRDRDIDANKRDYNWNTRDIDGSKTDNKWIKKERKTYKDDQNRNEWDRKQNDRENKYTRNVGSKAHERYEIVERKSKDGDYERHSVV